MPALLHLPWRFELKCRRLACWAEPSHSLPKSSFLPPPSARLRSPHLLALPKMPAARALAQLWTEAGFKADSLTAITLTGRPCLPSSFLVSDLAQATIGASALAASQLLSLRTGAPLAQITLAVEDAVAEFRSEQLGTLDGEVSLSLAETPICE